MNGLQFFVHNDPDAVRIELAGSLRAADADMVNRAWQRAAFTDAGKPVIVDITFISDADHRGRALLAVMRWFGTRIIAESPASYAIARLIATEPIATSGPRPGWFRRLVGFLRENRHRGVTHKAQAAIGAAITNSSIQQLEEEKKHASISYGRDGLHWIGSGSGSH